MRCERLRFDRDPRALVAQLRALVPAAESVSADVAEIVARVRAEGDAAVIGYTRALDTHGGEPKALRVGEEELERAAHALDPDVRHGLERAIANVEAVAAARVHREQTSVDFATHVVRLGRVPVSRAAVYVPGGRAPYPTTVVMGVVPARVAGVEDVAVCAPPGPDGEVNSTILAACRLAGASTVYRMGGAQAIAALAYGTESVPAVDVIVGPGNLYVQEAKRQVFGQVGIDGFAGPSDLLLLAGAAADPEPLALDLLAQAEHGPGTLVIAVSDDPAVLDALAPALAGGADTGAVAALVDADDLEAALTLAEEFAPEHFLRATTEVRIADGSELAREGAPVARAEGFEIHARSMEARIRDNHPR